MQPDHATQVKAEVDKLVKCWLLMRNALSHLVDQHRPNQEKEWVDPIYIDFRDLNKVCPKERLPCPLAH